MPGSRSPDRRASLESTRRRAATCRRCELWRNATQTVFGDGPRDAEVVFVGEQPGDHEDREGRPFVGPAGTLFRKALAEVGLESRRIYLTNAVKHFKWTPRGKRRLHERPNTEEMLACQLWLQAELAAIRPRAVVALGAVAARSLFGPAVRVTRDRGRPLPSPVAPLAMVTVHPSSILRSSDADARRAAWQAFVRDLRTLLATLDEPPKSR